MTAPLLEVRDLHAGYGATRVLHGLTFSIDEGSITTLLGANGAGKTTTLRALCAMVPATQGEVRFFGAGGAGGAGGGTGGAVAPAPSGLITNTLLQTLQRARRPPAGTLAGSTR